MGTQKTPLQKTYEINVGQDCLDIDFLGANRQVTNIPQYTTATMLLRSLKESNQ